MADSEVVTELIVDASDATDGIDQATDALLKMEAILQQLLSVMTGTTIAFKDMGDQMALTSSTGGGWTQTLQTFSTSANNATAATTGLSNASSSAVSNSNLLADSFVALQTGAAAATAGLGTMNKLILALGAGGLLAIAVAGLKELSDAANSQGDAADKIKTLADGYGLTVDQAQALITAGAQLDQSQDAVTAGLTRFSEQLDGVRQGSGNLYNELMRINPALTLQMQTTSSMAQELSLLSAAYAQAGAGADKLAKTALGNSSLGGVLSSISDAGSVSGLINSMSQFETATGSEVTQWADLKDQIDLTKQHAEGIFNSIFTESVLQSELATAEFFDRFAQAAKSFALSGDLSKLIDFFTGEAGGADSSLGRFFSTIGNGGVPIPVFVPDTKSGEFPAVPGGNDPFASQQTQAILDDIAGLLQKAVDYLSQNPYAGYGGSSYTPGGPFQSALPPENANMNPNAVNLAPQVSLTPIAQTDLTQSATEQAAALAIMAAAVDALDASEKKIPLSAQAAANYLKDQISALGGAATATEQMAMENAKLAANPALSSDTIARSQQYKDLQIQIASGQQLLSAGVGEYGNALQLENAKMDLLIKDHPELTFQQIGIMMGVAAKNAETLSEHTQVIASSLPQFTQALLDMQNANKIADTLATGNLSALVSAAADLAHIIEKALAGESDAEDDLAEDEPQQLRKERRGELVFVPQAA